MSGVNEMIISRQQVLKLVKNYNPLHYTPQLINLLNELELNTRIEHYKKFELHKIINSLVVKNYPGEQVLKYHLFKSYERKNLTAAFEVNVNKSRLDFLTINGHTTSFEIKSDLDNLTKLAKQSADYLKAFEYNNVVIQSKHYKNALEIIPEHFGVISFQNGRKKIYRPSVLNTAIDSRQQLSLLSKIELKRWFGDVNPENILHIYNHSSINQVFKRALKYRYAARWKFVTNHSDKILPIDVQFFFKTSIHPDLIYS